MTPYEHYLEAERLLDDVATTLNVRNPLELSPDERRAVTDAATFTVRNAQVHATLALFDQVNHRASYRREGEGEE